MLLPLLMNLDMFGTGTPTPSTGGGGGGINWQRRRKLKKRIDDEIRDWVDALVAKRTTEPTPQIVGASVAPYVAERVVDWAALRRDADAVGALLSEWNAQVRQREIDDDDEEFLMMH